MVLPPGYVKKNVVGRGEKSTGKKKRPGLTFAVKASDSHLSSGSKLPSLEVNEERGQRTGQVVPHGHEAVRGVS
jgi:hypothetical protein